MKSKIYTHDEYDDLLEFYFCNGEITTLDKYNVTIFKKYYEDEVLIIKDVWSNSKYLICLIKKYNKLPQKWIERIEECEAEEMFWNTMEEHAYEKDPIGMENFFNAQFNINDNIK